MKRQNFGIDPQFSYFSGYELRVLGTKIQDENFIHASILTKREMIGKEIFQRFSFPCHIFPFPETALRRIDFLPFFPYYNLL